MKQLILLCLLILTITSCTEEDKSEAYSNITLSAVEPIFKNGIEQIIIQVAISNPDNLEIDEYGFYIGDHKIIADLNFTYTITQINSETSDISWKIGKVYQITPYIKNTKLDIENKGETLYLDLTIKTLLESIKATPLELYKNNVTALELYSNGVSINHLLSMGVSETELKDLFSDCATLMDIINSGGNIKNIIESGMTVNNLIYCPDSNITVSDFVKSNVDLSLYYGYFSISELAAGGVPPEELFAMGVGVGSLLNNGYSFKQLSYANLCGTITDIQGNVYEWVKIGNQKWMTTNLHTSQYATNDNQFIHNGNGTCLTATDPNLYYTYEQNQYGYLYTWEAATNEGNFNSINISQGICPDGWHIPSFDEWKELFNSQIPEMYHDIIVFSPDATYAWQGRDNVGFKLQKTDNAPDGSENENYGASGFNAELGGYRDCSANNTVTLVTEKFELMGSSGHYISSTTKGDQYVIIGFSSGSGSVAISYSEKSNPASVRCVYND